MKEGLPEFERRPQEGSIEIICGCMFSGKSHELIRRVRREPFAGKKVQVFKPSVDNRRGGDSVNTYNKESYPAIGVSSSLDIPSLVKKDTSIVAIDEAQFFDQDLPEVCCYLANQGKRVIVAGLDSNFRGEPFGPMAELIIEADRVDKLVAYCTKCGGPASRTQRMRIIDGERVPADYYDPVVLVGEEEYEPRCRHCHEVPNKPEKSFERDNQEE